MIQGFSPISATVCDRVVGGQRFVRLEITTINENLVISIQCPPQETAYFIIIENVPRRSNLFDYPHEVLGKPVAPPRTMDSFEISDNVA